MVSSRKVFLGLPMCHLSKMIKILPGNRQLGRPLFPQIIRNCLPQLSSLWFSRPTLSLGNVILWAQANSNLTDHRCGRDETMVKGTRERGYGLHPSPPHCWPCYTATVPNASGYTRIHFNKLPFYIKILFTKQALRSLNPASYQFESQ